MKTCLLCVLGFALAGAACAADVSLPPSVGATATAAPDCGVPCPVKACAPEPTVKKTEKVIYDLKCVDYCLPRCSLFSLFGGDCGCTQGGCPNCGNPRTRHVLIKKFVHEECPEVKCEVKEQLPCSATSFPTASPPNR